MCVCECEYERGYVCEREGARECVCASECVFVCESEREKVRVCESVCARQFVCECESDRVCLPGSSTPRGKWSAIIQTICTEFPLKFHRFFFCKILCEVEPRAE